MSDKYQSVQIVTGVQGDPNSQYIRTVDAKGNEKLTKTTPETMFQDMAKV